MPISNDLRLSLLEFTHVVERLLRLYRTRPWRDLESVYDRELSRLSIVGELTLTQARRLLDQQDGEVIDYALHPPIHAPAHESILYRLDLRHRRLTRRRVDAPPRLRPNA